MGAAPLLLRHQALLQHIPRSPVTVGKHEGTEYYIHRHTSRFRRHRPSVQGFPLPHDDEAPTCSTLHRPWSPIRQTNRHHRLALPHPRLPLAPDTIKSMGANEDWVVVLHLI